MEMRIWLCSIAIAIVLHVPTLATLFGAIQRDSFHSLSMNGQIGLLLLTASLAAGIAWFTSHICDKRLLGWVNIDKTITAGGAAGLALKLGSALIVMMVLLSLSPQIYYQFYQLIIPGLPAQWVIQPERTASMMIERLTFSGTTTYASAFTGIVLWTVLAEVVVRHFHEPEKDGHLRSRANR